MVAELVELRADNRHFCERSKKGSFPTMKKKEKSIPIVPPQFINHMNESEYLLSNILDKTYDIEQKLGIKWKR